MWAAVLELNKWRRVRQDRPLVGYQELCRELAASGPGCFGELDSQGARSVLRRYSDAWFAAAKRRNEGDRTARFPRRRRALACPACQFTGHRDLSAAASIAARHGGGITPAVPAGVTHRRAGAHLPGVSPPRSANPGARPSSTARARPTRR
jgi:hypothetical protein